MYKDPRFPRFGNGLLPGLADQTTPPADPYGLPSAAALPAPAVDPVPAPVPVKRSLLDALLPGGEGLSRESRKSSQLAGAIAGGLSLLAAAGPHSAREIQPNVGQGLLGAFGVARDVAGAGYDAGYAQQDRESLQRSAEENAQMFRSLGIGPQDTDSSIRQKLMAGFVFMLKSGNQKGATAISEVLKSMGTNVGGKSLMPVVDKKTGLVTLINPVTGETVRELQLSPSDSASGGSGGKNPPLQRVVGPDGKVQFVNPYTKEVYSTYPGQIRNKTEAQSKAKAFTGLVATAISRMNDTLGGAGDLDKALATLGNGTATQLFRGAASQAATRLSNSANILAEAWLRMTTGAAYTATELANAKSMYMILPTDGAQIVADKIENMKLLQQMLAEISQDPELLLQKFGGEHKIISEEERASGQYGAPPSFGDAGVPTGPPDAGNIEIMLGETK